MPGKQKDISILGCGWLGLPLGRHLVIRGHRVRGSTATVSKLKELRQAGIEPYHLVLQPEMQGDLGAFFDADVLFISLPPPRVDDVVKVHRRQAEEVVGAVNEAGIDFVVLASTTGVYPKMNRVVTESDAGDPDRERARAVWAVEEMLRETPGFEVTVLRFGGLYGYDRQPGRWLAGREGVACGGAPVNLVHRDDAVGVATAVIEGNVRGEAFSVVSDAHPTRKALYTASAERQGFEPPTFADETAGRFKQVSNRHVKEVLDYRFRHPDPLIDAP